MPTKISDSELDILKIIWEHQRPMLLIEIVEELNTRGYQWKNNTILTFLARLTEKKFVKVSKIGRKNQYEAVVSEEAYLSQETKDFVSKVYEGEVKNLIATLVQNDLISSKELEEIKSDWGEKKS